MKPIQAALGTTLGILLAAPVASGVSDRDAQWQTVKSLREIGVAMTAWLEDNDQAPEPKPPCGPNANFGADCPPASRTEVLAALVPKYIADVPEKDGWGHPYQFVFSRKLSAIGVRSPGRDGRFEADTYTSLTFPWEAYDRDLVWWSGLFVRWPAS